MIRKGFTLVELLVVITILALVAGAVVALANGLTTSSAVTLTISTQKQLTNQISEYYQAHGKIMPNGFDSLIREDYAVAGATAVYAPVDLPNGVKLEMVTRTTNNVPNVQDGTSLDSGPGYPRGIIYTGYDVNQDGAADAGAKSKGLTLMSWSGQGVHTLTVAKLNAADKAGLTKLGITEVYDIVHNKDLDETGNLTYVKRTLDVGQPIVVLDPAGLGSTYNQFIGDPNFGAAIPAGPSNPAIPALNRDDKLARKPHFIVLGIGPNCTLIGDRRGGVQEAPACSTIITWITAKPRGGTEYYNRYMAVIKMPADPADVPSFAGVLDANGWGTRSATVWYSRNNE